MDSDVWSRIARKSHPLFESVEKTKQFMDLLYYWEAQVSRHKTATLKMIVMEGL